MDLFKFTQVTETTVLEQGQPINGATSTMWVERYSEPGEFQIVSKLSSGLRDFLPAGTLISHSDTLEVMIVENHEIGETNEEDPILTITGRTLETFLENRIVGINQARASSSVAEYAMTADYSWNQCVKLINDHINTPPANASDILTNVTAQTSLSPPGTNEARSLRRGDLHTSLRELLAVDDLGVKTIRRNTFGVGSSTQTILSIYEGVDRTASVIFSWKAGDLSAADYFFSDRKLKNSAYVEGRYVCTVVDLGPTKYNRRFMVVAADDLDGHLTAPPVGGALTSMIAKMVIRGQQALKSQLNIAISRADISNTAHYQYRKDFNVGDLVMLDGNFGQIAVMRITEYVEIEDENGESGHPTLSVV